MEDVDRERRRDDEHQEPDDPRAGDLHDGGGEVRPAQRLGAADARDVLGLLFLEDLHRVVDGHNTDEAGLRVDDGQRQEIRLADEARSLLLVGVDAGGEDVRVHEIADERVGIGKDQVAQAEHAEQAPAIVGHRQRVDRLGRATDAPQPLERLRGGHPGAEARHLRRHEPSGRVLRVAEERRGEPPLVRREPREQPVRDLGGHLLGEPGTVVRIHLLEELSDVRLAHALEELLLERGVEQLEDLERPVAAREPEWHGALPRAGRRESSSAISTTSACRAIVRRGRGRRSSAARLARWSGRRRACR